MTATMNHDSVIWSRAGVRIAVPAQTGKSGMPSISCLTWLGKTNFSGSVQYTHMRAVMRQNYLAEIGRASSRDNCDASSLSAQGRCYRPPARSLARVIVTTRQFEKRRRNRPAHARADQRRVARDGFGGRQTRHLSCRRPGVWLGWCNDRYGGVPIPATDYKIGGEPSGLGEDAMCNERASAQ